MVTICLPIYNQENTITMAINSVLRQDYENKEIIVIDDASRDSTVLYAQNKGIRLVVNEKNIGIGPNLTKCMNMAQGDYIIYLCGDDYFTDSHVVSDMVRIFEKNEKVGVIGRHYYQFLDGYQGAITRVDEPNIIISSCSPSGMGFRKSVMIGEFSNHIFIEMPYMVKKILSAGWGYYVMDYDTIAARIHPGGNTATISSYYTESPTKNWNTLVPGYVFYGGAINLKCRAPHLLLKEIMITINTRPSCLLSPVFWIYTLVGLLVPGSILRPFGKWYRHRITRYFCRIIERRENV